MSIAAGKTLPEQEAVTRFELARRLLSYQENDRPRNGQVRVVEGDSRHEGDLELDLQRSDSAGLIVDGNLDVDGTVFITWNLGGPFLLVTGNLRARNVVAGDGEIRVEGDADVDGLLLGIGNDGYLRIDGTTRARLIVNDDHAIDMTTSSPCWYNRDWPSGFPLSEHLHRDVPVERDEDGIEQVETDVLVARLRAGQPVLRDVDDPRPRKSYAEWLADCEAFGKPLAYVPRELIDPALCRTAVRSWGHALQYVPRELVTEELCDLALAGDPRAIAVVPEDLRTPERCRIAVERDGDLLHYVPLPLRTYDLCRRALETGESTQTASNVPKEVFTPELALYAVELYAGSLRHIPEEVRTREVCVAALKVNRFLIDEVPEALREELRARFAAAVPRPD